MAAGAWRTDRRACGGERRLAGGDAGGRADPRHWVLLTGFDETRPGGHRCYEPSSGRVVGVAVAAIRTARLNNVGFPRPFAFVLPTARELSRAR